MSDKLEHFIINVSKDRMVATLNINKELDEDVELPLKEEELTMLLQREGIKYGIVESAIKEVTTTKSPADFPIDIAKGKKEVNGKDSEIQFHVELIREQIKETEEYDFRNVMRIPSVQQDEKLATIIPATKGTNGKDVYGREIRAIDGKKHLLRSGKNIRFCEDDQSFYATYSGEVRLRNRTLEVQSVYEVHESVSMRTGNIDFMGSVVIHGDVPSGFTIKAKGDIKVNGLVEAAELNAGGSIYISEGFSGMTKGEVFAKENLFVGYINQGTAHAGKSIFVNNSILHSECKATEEIVCQNGNIIGGTIQAGTLIEAKDIGNRLNTKTTVCFGLKNDLQEELKSFEAEKENLYHTKEELDKLGQQLEKRDTDKNPKVRIALLRQRKRLELIREKISSLDDIMDQLNLLEGAEQKGKLVVRQYLYPNTTIGFGKYEETVRKDYYAIEAHLKDAEIQFINR